jgi:hypothetical protein
MLWALYQQVVSDALHFSCRGIGATVAVGFGIAACAIIAIAGAVSFKSTGAPDTRGFVAAMSAAAALIFALAVALQTLAAWIVRPCVA